MNGKPEEFYTEDDIFSTLSGLLGQLSPENLSWDGELSYAQTCQRAKQINKDWLEIQKKLGRVISDSDVEDWERKQRQ